jgi:glucose/arabinose dehydrogenase
MPSTTPSTTATTADPGSRRLRRRCRSAAPLAAALVLAACGESATLPERSGFGPDPPLPAPVETVLPTVNIAPAQPWPEGKMPTPAPGLSVQSYAGGLDHPRWVYVLPNGDVLVAETNAPERPLRQELLGIKGWVMGFVMKRAGAATPSADRITLLRDADGDGVAETRSVFIENLRSPFGMALVGDELFIANTDALVKVGYQAGDTQARGPVTQVAGLPGGPLNHHWTKGLAASADGSKLYVSVGSNSNVAEHGMAHETGRAAIWVFDRESGRGRIFASGLRNPVGMAWHGDTLWTAVNERDELGSDLVPDYLTSVRDGGFYGWPYSYFGQHVDTRVDPPRPDLVATAIRPDYALGNHTASLGLASARGSTLGGPFAEEGMFVGQHGSWNRRPASGYKVIYVPFAGAQPSGAPVDVLTGFLSPDGKAWGRPVGVAVDKTGALLVADDVGNVIWRVARRAAATGRATPPTTGAAAKADPPAWAQGLPVSASSNDERHAWITKSRRVSASSSP